jgi:polyhydroxyalkanoate synthesis regulator phasin
MVKRKQTVSDIIDEIISYTTPKSKEDLEKQIERDKINYLIWQVGVAVKELQAEVDRLEEESRRAS